MGYTAWSVIFGEQPSASKWNILGVNDAGFNDGTAIANNAIVPDRMSGAKMHGIGNTLVGGTPTTSTAFKIQAGSTVVTNPGTVTFPGTFPNGVLIVVATEGDMTSGGACRVRNYNTSGFIADFIGTGSVGVRVNWIAIGW